MEPSVLNPCGTFIKPSKEPLQAPTYMNTEPEGCFCGSWDLVTKVINKVTILATTSSDK